MSEHMDDVATRRWAVTYREGRRPAQTWAVIEGVPVDVKLPEVRAAIESWQRWPDWQRRMSTGGRFTILAEHRWLPSVLPDTADSSPVVRLTWAELAPSERSIGVRVDSMLWARIRASAAAESVSMADWCRAAYLDRLEALEG